MTLETEDDHERFRMTLMLSIKKQDGTVVENALEVIRQSTEQGRKVPMNEGDVLRTFHIHYKHRRKFWCLHFQRKNSRVWGTARINAGEYDDTDVLIVAAVN